MMNSSNPKLFSLFIFFSICSFKSSLSSANNPIFCPETEKQSLLSFKQSLEDPNNHLSSWDDEVNCCKWKGVSCNNWTGGVDGLRVEGLKGKINPSLLNLHHLKYLDLSKNNFSGETIPSFIGSLAKLEYLNLSGSRFHGKVPHSIGNLSKLHTFDLKEYFSSLHVDSLEWISRLSQLEYLNMNGVNLRKAHTWPQVINSLPRLLELHFDRCSLGFMATPNGYFNTTSSLEHLCLSNNSPYVSPSALSRWIFQLKNLVSLDLSYNRFDGIIPSSSNATKLQYLDLSNNYLFNSTIPEWLYLCNDLEYIDLSWNRLSGAISNSIANLTSLNTLITSSNQLSGKLPKETANLCKMQTLDLSENDFEGEISESFGDMPDCFLGELQTLKLSGNKLSGNLTNQFGEFKSLRYLGVERNSLSGVIPRGLGKLWSLEELELNNNKLMGSVPHTLGQLFNLETLSLEYNMLDGVVNETHFANLSKLSYFLASGNNLTLKVSPDWKPPFRLTRLWLASWKLGEGCRIPPWIETQKNLQSLDLSSTALSGDNIPTWVLNIPILILSHNRFTGSLPQIGNTLKFLDLSDNSFSGGMSHLLCNTTPDHTYDLEVLHLGWNRLSEELPDCWMKWPSLVYLNLGYNNISGSIPNSIGYVARLQFLNLPGNRLSGEIPLSIKNCTDLVKLDLANNVVGGGIPTWLPHLSYLILRSNNLTGNISSELCRLNSLQILDLSNNISGRIPRCFYNLTAMATKRTLYRRLYAPFVYWTAFTESASVAIKGREWQYGTTLSLVTNMDLSRNNLSGDIPKELTSLVELRSLNLSQNRFTGSIPENIGDMKQLEYLDLSNNSLSGHIPNSLTGLSFLKDLNISFNKLTGEIPKSTQLGGMDASSFIGNNLCGPPLTIHCSHDGDEDDGRKEEGEEEEGELKIEWIYVVTSLGYAVGLSAVCSALALNKSWRQAYFGLLERIWDKMYVYVCIKWNEISGRRSGGITSCQMYVIM